MNGRSPTNQSVFRGIRSSKFKHVYSCPAKKELCYDNIAITKNAHDSQFCAVNPKFVAIVTESAGGGTFIVIPIHETGRLDVNEGRVTGHRGPVLDLKWNPFNDNVIASSSDDCSVMLWYIPDEGPSRRGVSQPIITLLEHKRRVSMIEWHPTAENILISAGADHMVLVWNTCKGRVVRVINCHPDTIQSISINRDGSLVATTCKDKLLRIIDIRKETVIKSGLCHEGPKSSKVTFLGDSGRLFTTGFSKFSDRQWAVWSQSDLSTPLRLENIDSSSGILFPFYDHDTQMVYVAGKGDGSIRYYEVTDSSPWCFYINQLITGFPQRGMGVMPKRGVDVEKCEVFRFYKLHATRPLCEPISMIVPRKSTLFQNDLYPDTSAPTPAMTADEWLSGKNRPPIVMSMKTGAIITKTNKSQVFKEDAGQLINTGDPNIDRKFIFLSKENHVDYRPKTRPVDHHNQPNRDHSPNRDHFPNRDHCPNRDHFPNREMSNQSVRLMKSISVGNLNHSNGSQYNRVRKFPWIQDPDSPNNNNNSSSNNNNSNEPITVYEVVKDRVEARQMYPPRKCSTSFFPIDIDIGQPQQALYQIQSQPVSKQSSPTRKSSLHPSEGRSEGRSEGSEDSDLSEALCVVNEPRQVQSDQLQPQSQPLSRDRSPSYQVHHQQQLSPHQQQQQQQQLSPHQQQQQQQLSPHQQQQQLSPHHHQQQLSQSDQMSGLVSGVGNRASSRDRSPVPSHQVQSLLKRNQEEINYLKEQIKVKDAKICELEAIVKQLTLRN